MRGSSSANVKSPHASSSPHLLAMTELREEINEESKREKDKRTSIPDIIKENKPLDHDIYNQWLTNKLNTVKKNYDNSPK